MDMFNHSSPDITLRYIGIDQDAKDELYSLVQFCNGLHRSHY